MADERKAILKKDVLSKEDTSRLAEINKELSGLAVKIAGLSGVKDFDFGEIGVKAAAEAGADKKESAAGLTPYGVGASVNNTLPVTQITSENVPPVGEAGWNLPDASYRWTKNLARGGEGWYRGAENFIRGMMGMKERPKPQGGNYIVDKAFMSEGGLIAPLLVDYVNKKAGKDKNLRDLAPSMQVAPDPGLGISGPISNKQANAGIKALKLLFMLNKNRKKKTNPLDELAVIE